MKLKLQILLNYKYSMKLKNKNKNLKQEIYILDKKTKLKNIIVSNEDPFENITLSTKDDVWYSELKDDF